jgi:hypothetical protein
MRPKAASSNFKVPSNPFSPEDDDDDDEEEEEEEDSA